ncbi:hypothetical protein V757_12840 [Pelistega indica]|uniref:CdiI immunity protein domain-containing protein n=2 Tax=Alcaligenaceae TaxID=506 RepID=V8FPU8_9BURK|nr:MULTISPECIES: contact-dependent growth inhibition system immunity protein [Alcaligenaceae]ETD66319.1 hypothetical protein V757_12840 [Pelistega indica]SPY08293.1 Uncharacterised protein [Oligella urethralis]SUA61332.1 Uncharacterised protein [Oligella urethralis]
MHEDYPHLDQLVGAYFNQDYDLFFGTDDIEFVLDFYVKDNSAECLHQLIQEIADFEFKYADCLEEAFYKTFDPDIYFDDVPSFLGMVKKKVQKQLG